MKSIQTIDDSMIRGLESQNYIDKDTGEHRSIYTLNGELLESVKLSGRLADRSAALSLILRDLQSAKRWYAGALAIMDPKKTNPENSNYTHVHDLEASDEVRSLFVASVIFYGKAFSEASSRRLKMEQKWLDPSFHEQHEQIIHCRNNFAAHSGDLNYESAGTSILLTKEYGRTYFNVFSTRKQISLLDGSEDNFVGLYDHAIAVVKEKYLETNTKIMKCVESRSLSFWLLAANGKDAVNIDSFTSKRR